MSKSRDIADSATTINYIDGLTSDAQSQINTKATLDGSPTFTGTVTATAFSGDGSGLTGVESLPDQTGNDNYYLQTDGTNAAWSQGLFNPTNSLPASGATSVIEQPTLEASIFGSLTGAVQAASQWQLSTSSSFSTIAYDSGEVSGTGNTHVPTSQLGGLTQYYMRMRYKTTAGQYTSYSSPTSFTTRPALGQSLYSSSGSYSWVAPTGVTSVSVVVIGAGGSGNTYHDGQGGGGGALSYLTSYSVTGGNSYSVVVGAGGSGTCSDNQAGTNGGASWFSSTSVCYAAGGAGGKNGSNQSPSSAAQSGAGNGGGDGGILESNRGGATGAGGYSGNGGNSAYTNSTVPSTPSGGGGSGGYFPDSYGSFGGGGVGVLGEGSSGSAPPSSNPGGYGRGGSGGQDADNVTLGSGVRSNGGNYGGGGGGGAPNSYTGTCSGSGGSGAVRIIWGANRSYPSTNTADAQRGVYVIY